MANPLELSDEEFIKQHNEGSLEEPVEADEDTAIEEGEKAPDTSSEGASAPVEEDAPDTVEEEAVANTEDTEDESEEPESTAESTNKEEDPVEDKAEETTDEEEPQVDPLEYIYAPFKANGKEMKVESPEEVRRLMQMGANYAKKMAGLKPNLKLMKMLANNELLDEEKLSYLIDLDKKDPEAIRKLVQESEVDVLDMDLDNKTDYTPNAYTVDDKAIDLDMVLEEIEQTDSYNQTIDVIGNKWDDQSKQELLKDPSVIISINDQVASGVYDTISTEVDRQRMLGNLQGVSDIQAYGQVGNYLKQQGALGNPDTKQLAPLEKANKPKPDPKLIDRKKAASQTVSKKVKKASKEEFNPLEMSDEDFVKQFGGQHY